MSNLEKRHRNCLFVATRHFSGVFTKDGKSSV